MFVERSESRVRSARMAFVLLCVVPCAAVVGSALYRAGESHRRAVAAAWGRSLGLDLECDAVVHVRPGCVRIPRLTIRGPDGSVAATVESLEVETTPTEVRLRLPDMQVDPAAAAVLGRLARNWLHEPARHDRAWLVDVRSVRWSGESLAEPPWAGREAEPSPDHDRGFRVECVANDGRRAIRIRREPATDDEMRIVQTVVEGDVRTTVEGRFGRAVPTACVAAAIGIAPASAQGGGEGWCSGAVEAERVGGGWSGRIDGCVERFSAATIVGLLGSSFRLDGTARVDLARATFEHGRLVDSDMTVTIERGTVSQELIDRLIQVARCRAGEAYRAGESTSDGPGVRPFDIVACRMRLDRGGLSLRAVNADRGIVSVTGRAVLEPPADGIEPERLLWAFAPRDARPLPATPATAWLEPLVPAPPPATRR